MKKKNNLKTIYNNIKIIIEKFFKFINLEKISYKEKKSYRNSLKNKKKEL